MWRRSQVSCEFGVNYSTIALTSFNILTKIHSGARVLTCTHLHWSPEEAEKFVLCTKWYGIIRIGRTIWPNYLYDNDTYGYGRCKFVAYLAVTFSRSLWLLMWRMISINFQDLIEYIGSATDIDAHTPICNRYCVCCCTYVKIIFGSSWHWIGSGSCLEWKWMCVCWYIFFSIIRFVARFIFKQYNYTPVEQ